MAHPHLALLLLALSTFLLQTIALVDPTNILATTSTATATGVYIADETTFTVSRYHWRCPAPRWQTKVTDAFALDLGLSPKPDRKIVAISAANKLPFIVPGDDGWNTTVHLLQPRNGQLLTEGVPEVNRTERTPKNFRNFQVIDGQVHGFFEAVPFREARWVVVPSGKSQLLRTSFFLPAVYHKGFQFVSAFQNALLEFNLSRIVTNTFSDPFITDKSVLQEEPDRDLYNRRYNTALARASDGRAIYLAAHVDAASSTPGGFGTSGLTQYDTLLVQKISPSRLKPVWTRLVTTSPTGYSRPPPGVLSRIGIATFRNKVVVASAMGEGPEGTVDIEVTTLSARTGATRRTQLLETPGYDKVTGLHILRKGKVALVGAFNGASAQDDTGASPVCFLNRDGIIKQMPESPLCSL